MRHAFAGRLRLLIGVIAIAAAALVRPAAAQFTSFAHGPRTILEGNWQSCLGPDGHYSERIYDHIVNGVGRFEVHLGPGREFAIFKGVQDAHRDHASAENLLRPYRVPLVAGQAKHRWEIRSMNLAFGVTLAGGSRTDCESWYIVLEPLVGTSH